MLTVLKNLQESNHEFIAGKCSNAERTSENSGFSIEHFHDMTNV